MNKTYKKIAFLIVVIIFSTSAIRSQNDSKLSVFNYNPVIYNPAFSGSADGLNIVGIYSSQWTGFDGAPKTQYLSADTKLSEKKIGVGLSLYNDVIGPAKEYNVEGNFSYYIPINSKYKLALGIKGGVNSYKVDINQLKVYQPGEEVYGFNKENNLLPIVGIGMNLYSDKFYLGIATPNLLVGKYYNSSNLTIISQKRNYYYMTLGYKMELDREITLTPALLTRVTQGAPISVLTSLNLNWRDQYIAALNYEYNSSLGAFFGFKVFENLKVGYAYDFSINNFSNYNGGTHTLLIGFLLENENNEKCTCNLY
jgi:type IX secretion system PorP/SprF family membrane protein